ncbi:hypothetical protein BK659_09260 [Pseudomonas brassicacearum]|uniref:Permease n=1 Tax=Pseudomonas brassicacearum TaxID=930166 RepID=A0A423HA70_9PSED|nr:hypothetical protein [Pseudomonas brassicacearum]RON10080.1 hypothetical protein BK659_09260 [Pseudomonas brassicacearum]
MDRKKIKRQLEEMLEAGRSRTDTFKAFAGGEIKDRVLAYWIAAYPDQDLYEAHYRKINTLVTISFIQALLGTVLGYLLGANIGPKASIILAAIAGVVPLLFAYGFYRNSAQAYTIYIVLTISQLPRLLSGFSEAPLVATAGAVYTLGMLFFVMRLKSLLFPDFAFFGPKKVKGQYVFSN